MVRILVYYHLILSLLVAAATSASTYLNYSTVTGYFLQDEESTNATTFDYTSVNFGLINQTYHNFHPTLALSQWQQFATEVSRLNTISPLTTSYKVLFMGRHGEGYHNVAESYYGTPAWNCYYSLLNGNSTTTWADAHLTPNGIDQALAVNAFWRREFSDQSIRAPESYYVSPLFRCLQTANYTFSGLSLPSSSPFVPTIKEFLREGISEHTCDRRSNQTFIHDSFPSYQFEAGFTEYDELWTGVFSETQLGQDTRSKSVLDDIFTHDNASWISITSHSGEIASLLRVIGHRAFSLNTGAVIPVLVKVETVSSAEPTPTATGPSRTPSPHCTEPPVSSISGGSCVCPDNASPTTELLVTQTPAQVLIL